MVEASFVGEVLGKAVRIDDGGGGFHAKEGPGATAEVGEVGILCWHGGNGGGGVVGAHGDDGDSSETCGGLHLGSERSHLLAGLHEASELVAREADGLQQGGVEVAGAGIQHLGGGGHRIFTDCLAREHIDEGIGHEEYFVDMLKGDTAIAAQGIELEERIEGHELDARAVIDFLLRHAVGEVALHGSIGVGVPVAVRQSEELAVLAEEGEVTAPCVDADTLQGDAFCLHLPQSPQDFVVEVRQVPEDVAAQGQLRILETSELTHRDARSVESGQHSAAAGGAEIYGEIVSGHIF